MLLDALGFKFRIETSQHEMKSHNHLKYLKEAREKCPANLMHLKDVIEKMFAHRIFYN